MITIEASRSLYEDVDAVHDFDHVLRVLALAERLTEAEGADWEIVRTAALLHDVARGQGDRLVMDHAQAGADHQDETHGCAHQEYGVPEPVGQDVKYFSGAGKGASPL